MSAALSHLAALLVLAGSGAEPTAPHALFEEGQHEAAAAAFEQRYTQSHQPVDGLNAVIAWRTAGRYARARVLLSEIRRAEAPGQSPALRAALLDKSLGALTAAIVLTGPQLTPDTSLKVDGRPAERLDGAVVVAVGRRDLLLEREGCDPFHWSGVALPEQRLEVPVQLVCHRSPGTLHLTLGAPGAKLSVDGAVQHATDYDVDLALQSGPHHVAVERFGITLLDEQIEIEPATPRLIELRVPERARLGGIGLGATSAVFAGQGVTAAAGLEFTFLLPLSRLESPEEIGVRRVLFSGRFVLGSAATTVGEISSSFAGGVSMGVHHAFAPALQKVWDGRLVTLDVEPFIAEVSFLGRGGTFSEVSEQVTRLRLGEVVLGIDLGEVSAELALQPIGALRYTREEGYGSEQTEWSWSGGVTLRFFRLFFGG